MLFPSLSRFARRVSKRGRNGDARRGVRQKHRTFVPRLELLEDRTLLNNTIWSGAVNSNWNNAGNWSNGIPGMNDTAIFNNTAVRGTAVVDTAFTIMGLNIAGNWGGTISVDHALSVTNGLNLGSGNFGGDGAMTIGGTSEWSGGGMSVGTGGLANNGTLTLSLPGQMNLGGGGTLTNNGMIIHTGGGNVAFFNGTVLNNALNGTYEFRADSTLFNNGSVTNAEIGRAHV